MNWYLRVLRTPPSKKKKKVIGRQGTKSDQIYDDLWFFVMPMELVLMPACLFVYIFCSNVFLF